MKEQIAEIIRYADTSDNPVLIPESLKQDYLKAADRILTLFQAEVDQLQPLAINEWLDELGTDRAYKKDMKETYAMVLPHMKAQVVKCKKDLGKILQKGCSV